MRSTGFSSSSCVPEMLDMFAAQSPGHFIPNSNKRRAAKSRLQQRSFCGRMAAALATAAFCLTALAAPIQAQGKDSLQAIINDFWTWRMREFPEFASNAGEHAYDNLLETYTIESLENRKVAASNFSGRLKGLDVGLLSATEKLNFDLLSASINDYYLGGYKWMRYVAVNPVNYLEGVSVNDVINQLKPINQTAAAYRNVLSRLKAYPAQIIQQIALMREAIRTSMTNHNVTMVRVLKNIQGTLSTPQNASEFLSTFGRPDMDKVPDLTDEERRTMRSEASATVDIIYALLRNLSVFISQEYMPQARPFYGVSSFINGSEFYQACLRWHTSTSMTALQIHDLGLQEVERIKKNMEQVMRDEGFTGSMQEFQNHLRSDSRLYFNTEEELLAEYKLLIQKVDAKLSSVFNKDTMPNVPCNVVKMKTDGPGGMYMSPAKAGDNGTFIVNVNQPQKRAKFAMMALTLHEANPGHHYQSVAQLNAPGLPAFRRYTEFSKYYTVPYHFPFHTAYAEGWALYAESLGEEIGAYETALDRFGRYSSEIFRASRLVVDTGLHAFGWSRQQAIDFMMANTFDVKEQIENEIDRYITWPGQACAYKIGELKIKELRKKAEGKLGSNFDLKEFHSQVLHLGAVPLTTLEDYIDKWVSSKSNNGVCHSVSYPVLVILFFVHMICQ